jgi:hypothetical protein
MPASLLAEARKQAAHLGLNLFGVVDAERFDACQPKEQRLARCHPRCGTVVVLGSGGRDFWQRFAQSCAQAAATVALPAPQQFAGHCVRQVVARFHGRPPVGVVEPDRTCVSFSRLGEAAGFGTVSPVTGHLVHPEFGPWVTLRAALLFEGRPFGEVADASISDRFQPCCTCRQPCLKPSSEVLPADPVPPRHQGPCTVACRCRCGCPIGREHRDGIGEDAPSAPRPVHALRRLFGVSVLQFVPRFWRR